MSIPLSLYLHIPWCLQKCPYCDFNSHAMSHTLPEEQYIRQLLIDLGEDLSFFNIDRPLQSIFIGGGTPSVITGGGIARLLEGIAQQIDFADEIEITLEANPATVDQQYFKDYFQAGINRLSIGIQSFHAQQLKKLGRIHSPEEAITAVKMAQDIGFNNLNIDIMFGLPEQTEHQALADIEQAIALQTEHLSYYQLTLEPNTPFAHKPPPLPEDKDIDQRFDKASELLQEQGFCRYEVSAWSRARQSKHNLNYWQYGDYLGIGAGAHGKLTVASVGEGEKTQQIIRTTKPRAPQQYLQKYQKGLTIATEFRQCRYVKEEEKAFEFMLNTLRLAHGFDRRWMQDRGLFSEDSIHKQLKHFIDKELLIIDKHAIRPTALGFRFINDMIESFL